jgi:signal-transduction protein with cAMP-binding, CBS, and nucleotidyltransferase domain
MESNSLRPLNRLLLALPADDLNALTEELELAEHQQGAVLVEAGGSLEHVFFPATGVLSFVAVYPNGDLLQAASVGREGCSGVGAMFGAASSSFMISVPISGSFHRMSRSAFQHSVKSMQSFRNLMWAYLQAFTEQVMLQSACCPHHSLKQRLTRDLLTLRDRTDGNMVAVTHDGLARMLPAGGP